MTAIIDSIIVSEVVQQDGRIALHERHADSSSGVHEFHTLIEADPNDVLAARAVTLNAQLAARDAAQAVVSGTLLPITKLQFKRLFTSLEQMTIDGFNATFEGNGMLSDEEKAAIRTGLENYKLAVDIPRPFDAEVQSMLGLYQMLGIITQDRVDEIIAAGEA